MVSEPAASELPPQFSMGTRAVTSWRRIAPSHLRSPMQPADLTFPYQPVQRPADMQSVQLYVSELLKHGSKLLLTGSPPLQACVGASYPLLLHFAAPCTIVLVQRVSLGGTFFPLSDYLFKYAFRHITKPQTCEQT